MSKKPPYLRVWRFYYHLSVGITLVIVEEIADVARKLADQGASSIYIFFNNDFGVYAPANVMTLLKMLRAL